jgi:hypothetical protein
MLALQKTEGILAMFTKVLVFKIIEQLINRHK